MITGTGQNKNFLEKFGENLVSVDFIAKFVVGKVVCLSLL